MTTKIPVLVLGTGINGLCAARNLHRYGIPVIGVENLHDNDSRFSRYFKKIYVTSGTEISILETILKIRKEINSTAVLIPTNDIFLSVLSDNQKTLEKQFKFKVPKKELAELTTNKKGIHKLAMQKGLNTPKSYFPCNMNDLLDIMNNIYYPCGIKPQDARTTAKIGKKFIEVNTSKELFQEYLNLPNCFQDFMIQELVVGPEDQIFSYIAYCKDLAGPYFEFCGRKLRQNPPKYGMASLLISEWNNEVIELSRYFLKSIGFEGLAGVEFKKDARDGELKFIEINSRLEQLHGITRETGVDISYAYYCDMIGQPLQEKPFISGKKWILLINDLSTSYKYIRNNSLTIKQWIASLKGINYYADLDLKDPLPFLCLILGLILNKLNYIRQSFIEVYNDIITRINNNMRG